MGQEACNGKAYDGGLDRTVHDVISSVRQQIVA